MINSPYSVSSPKILLSMVTLACCWSVLGSNRPRSCGLRCDTWTNREQSAPEPRIRWSSQPPSRGGARAAFDDPLVSSLFSSTCSLFCAIEPTAQVRIALSMACPSVPEARPVSCPVWGEANVTSHQSFVWSWRCSHVVISTAYPTTGHEGEGFPDGHDDAKSTVTLRPSRNSP